MITNSVSDSIISRLKKNNIRFNANDNITDYINNDEIPLLIDELTNKFEGVLSTLLIDYENDPNSKGTPRRLAKMYFNELMEGRYIKRPSVTAFPNTNEFNGIIVVKCDFVSMCSHHHQPVKGKAFIGLNATTNVIGLSKYTRIVQWCARRGQLQEDLTMQIANEIQQATGAQNIGVYIEATHGCMENRGIGINNSTTQTTVLLGTFQNSDVKSDFFNNIKLQLSN